MRVGCAHLPLVLNKSMVNYASGCGSVITHSLCFQTVLQAVVSKITTDECCSCHILGVLP